MKRQKRVLAWLLVMVMTLSMIPANFVRATEQVEENASVAVTETSLEVEEEVAVKDSEGESSGKYVCVYTNVGESYRPVEEGVGNYGFTIEVPEQDGVVVAPEEGENTYCVTGSTITVQVAVPDDCDTSYVVMTDGTEEWALEATEDSNVYTCTIALTYDRTSVFLRDTEYIPVYTQINSGDYSVFGDSGVKTGETYTYKIRPDGTSTMDNLLLTLNGEDISESLKESAPDDDGYYSYVVENVQTELDFQISDTKGSVAVWFSNESEYATLLDSQGNEMIFEGESSLSMEVSYGEDLVFYVTQAGGNPVVVTYDEKVISGVDEEDGKKKYTISSVTSARPFVRIMDSVRVSLDGTSMYPCTSEGVILDGVAEDGVSEWYVPCNSSFCFKLNENEKYRVSNGTDVIDDYEGVYSCGVEQSAIEMTAERYYQITRAYGDGYCTYLEDAQVMYEYLEEEEASYEYVPTDFDVYVHTDQGWDVSDAKVYVTQNDGTKIEAVCEVKPEWNDEAYAYVSKYSVVGLTDDATINVEGVCSTEANLSMHLYYSEDDQISFVVRDGDGNAVEENEGSSFEGEYYAYSLYGGKKYFLEITGDVADLANVKVTNGEDYLDITLKDGVVVADITNCNSVHVTSNTNKYFLKYEGDVGAQLSEWIGDLYYAPSVEQGFYSGSLSFFFDSQDSESYNTENTCVTAIKDGKGNDVKWTEQTNVEVDGYGTKRTVYTVEVTDDITIYYGGTETVKYDVYLPVPTNEEYEISSLYLSYWDADVEEEVNTPIEGVLDTQNGWTKYSQLEVGEQVGFAVTVSKEKGIPYVEWSKGQLLYPDNQIENEDTITYKYRIFVSCMGEVLVSTNAMEMNVVTKDEKGCVILSQSEGVWSLYDAEPFDVEDEDAVNWLGNIELPRIVNMDNADDLQFYYTFSYLYEINRTAAANVFSLMNEEGDIKALDLGTAFNRIEGYVSILEGYNTLVVDLDCIVERIGSVYLQTNRTDMEIAIYEGDGTTYKTYTDEGGIPWYIAASDKSLRFQITADSAADFDDDFYLDINGYTLSEDYEIYDGGKTRVYTLTDVILDGVVSVTYSSTVRFEESEYGGVYTNVMLDVFPAYMDLYLNVYVEEGYDADSLKVIQTYWVNGEEQKIVYTDLLDGNSWNDRECKVTLQPGENVFTISKPDEKTYSVTLPSSVAYKLALVNGSTTQVKYKEDFSFMVNANEGYDLSNIVVTANGQRMTPTNGVYTVKQVSEDLDIAVTGFKVSQYVVTFKDYDGKVLKTEKVQSGKNATPPTNPTRKSYTFAGWSGAYKNVKADKIVTATYKPVLVSKIKIEGDTTKLAVGKTAKLKAVVTPADALNTGVVWQTSNKKYATVDANGKVKALKAGAGKTVTITAVAKDGSGVKATYKIKIYKKSIKKIKLYAKTKTVKPGKKVTIKAVVSPSSGVNKTLKWSTSNKKYATVNSKGVVTTKKAGKGKTVTITAKATDGSGKKATIKIKIKKK